MQRNRAVGGGKGACEHGEVSAYVEKANTKRVEAPVAKLATVQGIAGDDQENVVMKMKRMVNRV